MTETWGLFVPHPTWTVNTERKWVPHRRAAEVRECRETAAWAAKIERVPPLAWVEVSCCPVVPNGRHRQDVGGCLPTAKACVDGLVDAGVLPDDGPEYVRRLCFVAPVIDRSGQAGLRMVLRGERA